MESLFNKTLESVVAYLQKNSTALNVESFGLGAPSCPFTFNEALVRNKTVYRAAVCITVMDLIVMVSPVMLLGHFRV